MDSKYVFLSLGSDIALLLVSAYFIYKGIQSGQIAMTIVGGVLLLWGIIRLIIFISAWNKRGDE